jgi:hypothetical protein
MCRNYKQLSSGAPDLLLVRVQLQATVKQEKEKAKDSENETNEREEEGGGYSVRVTVPLDHFLGEGWDHANSTSGRQKRRNDWDDENLLLDTTAAASTSANMSFSRSYSKHGNNVGRKRSFGRMYSHPAGVSQKDGVDNQGMEKEAQEIDEDKDTVELISADRDTLIEELQLPDSDEEMLRIAKQYVSKLRDGTNTIDEKEHESWKTVFHLCDQQSKESQTKSNMKICWKWCFESMFVEVKGPTDHLAYKQLLWLKLLSLSHYENKQTKAFVCHVKEK